MKNLPYMPRTLSGMIKEYIKELKYLKLYILVLTAALILFWSFHYFMTKETMITLGREDGFFEWLTIISFLVSSALFFTLFFKTRNLFYLLLGAMFFIGFGEEISWGYRIIHYDLPDIMDKTNVSKEFNLHNMEVFNTMDLQMQDKHGFERLLEIEFLFKVFTLVYGFCLPFFVYHSGKVGTIARKIKLPVPPIVIGIFFILNYIAYKVTNTIFAPDHFHVDPAYIYSFVEDFECLESFIFLAITLYFFNKRDIIIPGRDIKQLVQA